VLAGLAVGIAIIIVFSIIFEPAHNIAIVRVRENDDGTLTFQPQVTIVLSGVNNTVRWINDSNMVALIAADNDRNDPAFYNATNDFIMILPHHSYEYTFTGLGEIGYHGRPSERGSVIVLHALPVK